MKKILAIAFACFFLPGAALAAGEVLVHRDPGCGCCEEWAQLVQKRLGRKVVMRDDTSRASFQKRNGVPAHLSSCHTAIVDGLLLEGHVPVADIQRVLATRPAGVKGLAVAGMPMGSEGMEVPGGARQRYAVVAFGPAGERVFARH